jgi:hypothetical protein
VHAPCDIYASFVRDRRPPAVAGVAVHLCGAAVVLVGSFMPWIRSGRRRRSSYDILDLADRLGFSPHGALGWAVRCWPLMPLVVVVSVVAAAAGRRGIAVPATVVGAAYVMTVAVTVRRAPRSALIGIEAGTWVSMLGAVALLVGAAIIATRAVAPGRREGRLADR